MEDTFTIFIPSLGRERQTISERLNFDVEGSMAALQSEAEAAATAAEEETGGSTAEGEGEGEEKGAEGAKRKVLIIGCAGAVGTALAERILATRGPLSVVAALRRTPLPEGLAERCICEFGIDVR